MIFLNFLFAILIFVIIYLIEKLLVFLFKKKPFWPLFNYDLLIDAIAYTVLSFLLITIIHLVFKKINPFNLLWLDVSIYLFIKLIKPHHIFLLFKNKEKKSILQKHYFLGGSLLLLLLLECFVFNSQAYSQNKEVKEYSNFISETISTNGEISDNKIILKNKQFIEITTNKESYDNIYLHFNNDDMNLYVNFYKKNEESGEYEFMTYALIDPKIDAFGYIKLGDTTATDIIRIQFDIDDTRYLNDESKPLIIVDKIAFDAYFPFIFNPLRIGLIFSAILLGAYFKKLFIDNKVNEEQSSLQKIEKLILFGGALVFTYFIIQALVNNSAYFVKYDELYLGGTSSNNIYYQQFDAYIKGQLHLDVPVDSNLAALSNPYDPYARAGLTYLWDHAFYNGKYYSYYGHAPIYLVMLPIYLVSHYVPSNLFVLQFGVIASVFTFLLVTLQLIKLFIKKNNTAFVVLVLLSALVGSMLFTVNTYEYGAAIYRIPYAYANAFLFLTLYFFLKGYFSENRRFLYFIFAGLSLVFIVLSRPLVVIYLLLFVPLIVKMIKADWSNKKKLLVDYLPFIGVVLVGAIFICVINYMRFESVFEFGEHYQLTVTDCTKNHLDYDGIIGTIYHYFVQPPKYDARNGVITYRFEEASNMDVNSYIMPTVGLFFVPITLFFVLIPYIIKKEDELSLKLFLFIAPAIIFFVAFVNYCFAGACPRYLLDVAPFASILGAICDLKALEKDEGKHPVVPSLIFAVLVINILLTGQYHFAGFDGLKIGDFGGLFGILKTIVNRYNI